MVDLPTPKKGAKPEPKSSKERRVAQSISNTLRKIDDDRLKSARDVVNKKTRVLQEDALENASKQVKDYIKEQGIVFKPNPGPQTEFLSATEQEVLYGGAAGG